MKTDCGMEWYVAKLVYQIVSSKEPSAPQIDEQYRLIRADDPMWAWEKATTLGKLGECKFTGYKNSSVEWKFINVVDLHEIGEIKDGAELFSYTNEPNDLKEYMAVNKQRARRLMDIYNYQSA